MKTWGSAIRDSNDADIYDHAESAIPPCGTICCFAGEWALRYGKIKPEDLAYSGYFTFGGVYLQSVASKASEDLDLPNSSLFYEENWPVEVRMPRGFKAGTRRYAEWFVDVVLEDYIKTDGWTK
jgi:hypothetical protein